MVSIHLHTVHGSSATPERYLKKALVHKVRQFDFDSKVLLLDENTWPNRVNAVPNLAKYILFS